MQSAIIMTVPTKKNNEFDFLPFVNIMNEWYAQDTSNKIQAIFKSRMQDGKRCSGSIPFGYYRKPDDKQTLHVAPEASKTIKRIFELVASGKGVTEVARIMSEERYQVSGSGAFTGRWKAQSSVYSR